MKPVFKCELDYFPSPHLSQVYDGFEKLRKIGIVDISIKPASGNVDKPLLKVRINNKYNVIYDTLDGFNWIDGTVLNNLEYFQANTDADYYFKRSFNDEIIKFVPNNCKLFPLGLNIAFKPEGNYPKGLNEKIKSIIRDNYFVSRFYKKKSFSSRDFEFYPIANKKNMILLIAGLWNPEDEKLEHLKIEIDLINRTRIDCIRACQKEFGRKFTGGLIRDSFSIKQAKDLIMPDSLTNRETFLNSIREHNICIATTGLHGSIGWKLAEYVAASRAILSEPLIYKPTGDFKNDINYLNFDSVDELLNKVYFLLKNRDALIGMMNSNFQYYNNYLRPDKLVLNTLMKIYEEN